MIAWAAPFALVLAVLLVRNAFLFSTPEYENADMGGRLDPDRAGPAVHAARRPLLAAASDQPGPAFLYVQAWGESLFDHALHLVPTAWNGQLIGLYALNALFAASVVAVGYGWTRLVGGAAATLAAVALLGALYPTAFSSDWMPYVSCFLTSPPWSRSRRWWPGEPARTAGWRRWRAGLLIHSATPPSCSSSRCWRSRRWRRSCGGGGGKTSKPEKSGIERSVFSPPARRVWIPVAAISAVFALPMAVELALHWPGNFVKYVTYTSSAKPVMFTPHQLVRYVLWFWWPHEHAWALAVVLLAAAAVATWRLRSGPLRRFCGALLAADALSTVMFLAYAKDAADSLTNYYIGYFYWTAPLLAVLVIALTVTELVPGRVAAVAGTCAAVAAAAAFAVAPLTRFDLAHVDPETPSTTGIVTDPTLGPGTAFLAQRANGRPLVFRFESGAWRPSPVSWCSPSGPG